MHASNPHRNEEETWFLIEFIKDKHYYSFQKRRNGKYLSKNTMNHVCTRADHALLTTGEIWELISGDPYNVIDGIALKNTKDGTFLGANPPGVDTLCGGEVGCGDTKL